MRQLFAIVGMYELFLAGSPLTSRKQASGAKVRRVVRGVRTAKVVRLPSHIEKDEEIK